MDTASKILVLGGLFQLVVGFLSGLPYGLIRARGEEAPKYLRFVHVGSLMQGPMLLGLVFAVQMSPLSTEWEIAGASGITASAAILILKDSINGLTGVTDEFAQKSIGLRIGGLVFLFGAPGLAILCVGAVMGI